MPRDSSFLGMAKVADLMCGAGGTSSGARKALADLGFDLELVGVNHWDIAIASHAARHPGARHYCASIDQVRPIDVVPSGRLDLLIASPSCVHHSVARGGRPTSDQQRSDPWHLMPYLTQLKVDRLLIENVPEFVSWGPVDPDTGRPIRAGAGDYFAAWVAALRALGWQIEHRVLNCADYGDATTRKRWFLMGRSDGKPIRWPTPSHADPRHAKRLGLPPWRGAREIIDFSIRGKSIFDRPRPLATATLRRILSGAERFQWPEPFLILLRGAVAGRRFSMAQGLADPLPALTAGGTHVALAQPILLGQQSCSAPRNGEDPLPTISTAGAISIAEAILLPQRSNQPVQGVDRPLPTVTTISRHALAQPMLIPYYGTGVASAADAPLHAVTTKARFGLAEPMMVTLFKGSAEHSLDDPLNTLTTKATAALAEPFVMPITHQGADRAHDIDRPLPTITTAHRGELALIQTAAIQAAINGAPPERLVQLEDGSTALIDILFRMLEPHELAAAMSLEGPFLGTKTDVIKQIGNAVPGRVSQALVSSLCADLEPSS